MHGLGRVSGEGPRGWGAPLYAVGRRAGPVALRAAVLDRLGPYPTTIGGYRLMNLFRVLVARPGERLSRRRPCPHTGS